LLYHNLEWLSHNLSFPNINSLCRNKPMQILDPVQLLC
jgi:hypothetical protein